jgi:hypothetical protein
MNGCLYCHIVLCGCMSHRVCRVVVIVADRGGVPSTFGMGRACMEASTCVAVWLLGLFAKLDVFNCTAMGSDTEKSSQFPADIAATVDHTLVMLHVFVWLSRWGAGVTCRSSKQGPGICVVGTGVGCTVMLFLAAVWPTCSTANWCLQCLQAVAGLRGWLSSRRGLMEVRR